MLRDERDTTIDDADALGQRGALDTLLHAVDAMPAPGCIALYGAWGAGKTVLLRSAQARIEARDGQDAQAPRHLTVWFDPWQYERRDDLLSPMLHALAKAVETETGADPDRLEKVKRKVLWLAKAGASLAARVALRWVSNGIVDLSGATSGDAREEHPIRAIDDVTEEDLTRYHQAWSSYQDEIEQVKSQFAKLVNLALGRDEDATHADARRVVFFLDDLDRCLPERVVHLIEAVKLLLCGAPTGCDAQFVFALDRHIVGEAIRQQYPGASQYTGENYLEKIFDLSLEAPPVGEAHLTRYVEQLLTRLAGARALGQGGMDVVALTAPFGTDGRRLLVEALGKPHFANPRVVKRTLNRLYLLSRNRDASDWVATQLGARSDTLGETRRCLAWLAGAERFRAFRKFFDESAIEEVNVLSRRVQSSAEAAGPVAASPAIALLASAPGMYTYFRQLTDGSNLGALHEERSLLRQFDRKLREIGL